MTIQTFVQIPFETVERNGRFWAVEVPEQYSELPLHTVGADGVCSHCGDTPFASWATFQEYTDWFYQNEWEGDRHHTPGDEHDWNYVHHTCLG